MRFISFIAAATLLIAFLAGSSATPSPSSSLALASRDLNITAELGTVLNAENFYGAPTPPWESGAKPGWYFGDQNWLLAELGWIIPCLKDQVPVDVFFIKTEKTYGVDSSFAGF